MPLNSKTPKYHRIADQLRQEMEIGNLQMGDRLPSFAQMYQHHGATVSTMRRVYELLEKDNLIERRGGSGVYVAGGKSTFTGNIGLVGTMDLCFQQSNYYKDLLRGIEDFAAQHGQLVVFLRDYFNTDMPLCDRIDGVLMCNIEYQQHRLKHLPANLPRVSMFTREENVANVIADDYNGAQAAVRHLVELGHRQIAFLAEKPLSIPRQRFAGYQEALSEAGIEINPHWAKLTGVVNVGENPPSYLEWGRAMMHSWLREDWQRLGCTAILVQNDAAAIGVMHALQEEDIDVPGRVNVMGFDGTELCDHVYPQLCSMKVPLEEIGYKAAQTLHEQIQRGQQDHQTIMLPMSLRKGASVADVREMEMQKYF